MRPLLAERKQKDLKNEKRDDTCAELRMEVGRLLKQRLEQTERQTVEAVFKERSHRLERGCSLSYQKHSQIPAN